MGQTCAWRHLRHCHCQKQAIDEDGVVVDILLREYRDTASAEAFFRQTIERSGVIPNEVVSDHHQPHVGCGDHLPWCSAHPDGLH